MLPTISSTSSVSGTTAWEQEHFRVTSFVGFQSDVLVDGGVERVGLALAGEVESNLTVLVEGKRVGHH